MENQAAALQPNEASANIHFVTPSNRQSIQNLIHGIHCPDIFRLGRYLPRLDRLVTDVREIPRCFLNHNHIVGIRKGSGKNDPDVQLQDEGSSNV